MNNPFKYKILIIDDEIQIRRMLRMTLELNDYKVFEADNGKDGLLSTSMNNPDIVLLDLGLPDTDGLTVLNQIRSWSEVPVIVLTVEDNENTKVTALDSGANDYVTKPFNTRELLARIRVALRYSTKTIENPVFKSNDLSIDFVSRIVKSGNEEIKLTATEYALLVLFAKNAGKVLTHNFITKAIWSNPYADNTQILRVHIAQLRKKIEKNSSVPEILLTEPGVGYRMKITGE